MNANRLNLRRILIVAAAAIAAFALAYGVTATFAAINSTSAWADSNMQLGTTDIALLENGNAADTLLTGIDDQTNGKFLLGHTYDNTISAVNNSSVPCYVRIIVTKYWTYNDTDEKVQSVDPSTIDLGDIGAGWVEDSSAATSEQSVYYYGSIVPAGGVTNVLFSSLTIDPSVANITTATETNTDGVVTTVKTSYGGLSLNVKAEAQLVQAEDESDGSNATTSAWGVNVHDIIG